MAALADGEQVYATLLLTDSYLPGVLVLAHSLHDAGASRKLVVFFTLDSVSADSITQLRAVFDHVIPVPRIRNDLSRANLYLMNRPDLDSAFTKINLWKQTQFSRIVYVDADVVAYRAPDELFALPSGTAFAAAPDIGWPDLFNTGVMVLTPNMGDYYALLAMAERGISFDGADQGLLNMYFKNSVHHLSFTYNVTPSAHYQYLPAYRHFQSSINMVHFIGPNKPWFEGRHAWHGDSPYGEMVARWWSVYDRHYRSQHESPPQIQISYASPQQELQPPPHQHSIVPFPQPDTQRQTYHNGQSTAAQPSQPPPSPPMSQFSHNNTNAKDEAKKAHSRDQSWDAQRQPPPKDSKPEAENFPNTHYTMSQDVKPFVPPARYPSPPKDMWYEVPKQRPAPSTKPPQVIFPWESHQTQASRAFPAIPDEPPALKERSVETQAPQDTSAQVDSIQTKPSAATTSTPPTSIWSSFTLVNAWDDVPEINRYVERTTRGHRRGKSLPASVPPAASKRGGSDVPKPTSPRQKQPASAGAGVRSLRLTDFPTEVERPSLPVTPAPVRRPSFWGDNKEGDAQSKDGAPRTVPTAEGVPAQYEWDPSEQLQKLAAQHSEELLRRLSGADNESLGMLNPSPPLAASSSPPATAAAAASPTNSPPVLSPTPVKPTEATPRALQHLPSGNIDSQAS